MSFWKKLFNAGKKEPVHIPKPVEPKISESQKAALLKEVEVVPGVKMPQAMANHWDEIQKTAEQTITITATPVQSTSLMQSKLAHYPCIPKGYKYPVDRDGNYLFPLAQINCSELPTLGTFPTSGYLQFYIGTDELYGMSFDENIPGSFKVLYFTEDELTEVEEDMSFLNDTLSYEYKPVFCPHSLQFSLKTEYIGCYDYNGDGNPYMTSDKLGELYPAIADELSEYVYEHFCYTGHKLGGYAYFTQADPRGNGDIDDYILLFQVDTDEQIMWGDSGVANFFIHPDDLIARDFSKVYYQWDCC